MSGPPGLPPPGGARRRAVAAGDELVRFSPAAGRPLPATAEPVAAGVDLVAWAQRHRQRLAGELRAAAAILLRGFVLEGAAELAALVRAVSGEALEYTYRSTPRTRLGAGVYTSTEYPASQAIPLHNEMSYARDWPMKIFFLCRRPAVSGGETPIADSRRVLRRLDPALVRRFRHRGVAYVRNYGRELDLPWEEVFGTGDRGEVETFCRRSGIATEWLPGGRLRTRQVCQGTARHPATGDEVWFNQAHLFHPSNLPEAVREPLLAVLGPGGLPRDATFGDGSQIAPAMLAEVRAALAAEAVPIHWQSGDVLLLDNMLAAHGRAPFSGERELLVGMSEPHSALGGGGGSD